ncbi:MAG: hypothetical protein K6E59_02035, partial [Bacilli bacterium]|nr:hypothetical protein [Bacilli bacterium]
MGKLGFKIKKSLLPFHMLFGRKHYRKAVKNLYAKTGAVIFAGDPKYIDRSAKLDVFGGGKIYIGDQTVITQETIILVHDYSIDCGMVAAGLADPDNESILVKDVHIGNNTFIGQRATILPG